MSDTPTPCNLCNNTQFSIHLPSVLDYITSETFSILRCTTCGLCVTDPLVPDSLIEKYYPPRYRVDRQKQTGGTRVRLRAAAVERATPVGFCGRLLDLGCGTGAFAMEMKRHGWDLAVTELNDAVLDQMRSAGMEAKCPDEALRDGFGHPFDVITAWHVLEHVESPMELTKWARANLKPDGILMVTVPNLMSWQARMFGRDWLHLDVPRHRYHFSPGTLAKMLIDAEFQIVRSSSFAFEYDLFGVIQSALNRVCSRPNVLFEKLTGAAHETKLPTRDLLVSYALSPPLAGLALPLCLTSSLLGTGATLTVTATPRIAV